MPESESEKGRENEMEIEREVTGISEGRKKKMPLAYREVLDGSLITLVLESEINSVVPVALCLFIFISTVRVSLTMRTRRLGLISLPYRFRDHTLFVFE